MLHQAVVLHRDGDAGDTDEGPDTAQAENRGPSISISGSTAEATVSDWPDPRQVVGLEEPAPRLRAALASPSAGHFPVITV